MNSGLQILESSLRGATLGKAAGKSKETFSSSHQICRSRSFPNVLHHWSAVMVGPHFRVILRRRASLRRAAIIPGAAITPSDGYLSELPEPKHVDGDNWAGTITPSQPAAYSNIRFRPAQRAERYFAVFGFMVL